MIHAIVGIVVIMLILCGVVARVAYMNGWDNGVKAGWETGWCDALGETKDKIKNEPIDKVKAWAENIQG